MFFKSFLRSPLNSSKVFRNLPITESNFSNVAGVTLLKSFFLVYIIFQILQEFRNNDFKEHLRKAASAEIKYFDLKLPF